MSIVQEPSAVHRFMPLARLRGPLQAIVNDPVKFGLLLPDSDRDESGLDAKLTTACVKAVHGLSSDLPPPEATLQIVGAEHRKKLDSSFAAGGKYQMNIRLTLWDGEHTMAGIVDTRATARETDIWDVGNVISIRRYITLPYSAGEDTSVFQIALLVHDVSFVEARLVEQCEMKSVHGYAVWDAGRQQAAAMHAAGAVSGACGGGGGGGGDGGGGGGGVGGGGGGWWWWWLFHFFPMFIDTMHYKNAVSLTYGKI